MATIDMTPIPSTPTMIPLTSSPSMEVATPPDSVRRYANALKAFTRVGMDAAIADSQDETRIEERRFDIEFGYDDEDPIERHVRLYLTPKKGAKKDAPIVSLPGEDQDMLHVELDRSTDEMELDGPPGMALPFRPGLIHFQRSSRGSIPSLAASAPSYTRTESSMSTPFGFDADRLRDMDTPGSTWSDGSFEAVKADDWVSLYGAQGARKRQQPWHGDVDEEDYRSSIGSDITAQPSSPHAGSSKRPSLLRPRPRACPYPPPEEVIRSRQSSGRYDADCREFGSEPRCRTTSGGSGPRSRQNSDNVTTATLSSLSCRSRQSTDNSSLSTLGSRSRQNSDDVKIAKLSALGLGPTPVSEDDEDWMMGRTISVMGRTISETMVVQAGFRSQKGRPAVRVVR